jgi:hypothetical protein
VQVIDYTKVVKWQQMSPMDCRQPGQKRYPEAPWPISSILARFWKGDFPDSLIQLSQPGEKPLSGLAEALKATSMLSATFGD